MTPCIRCSGDATYGHRLHPLDFDACLDCFKAWIREESCSMAEVVKACGFPEEPLFPRDHGRITAELERRTRLWLGKEE